MKFLLALLVILTVTQSVFAKELIVCDQKPDIQDWDKNMIAIEMEDRGTTRFSGRLFFYGKFAPIEKIDEYTSLGNVVALKISLPYKANGDKRYYKLINFKECLQGEKGRIYYYVMNEENTNLLDGPYNCICTTN